MKRKIIASLLTLAIFVSPVLADAQAKAEETDRENLVLDSQSMEDAATEWLSDYIQSIHPTSLPALAGGICYFTYDVGNRRVGKIFDSSSVEYSYDEEGWLQKIVIGDSDEVNVEYEFGLSTRVSTIFYSGETFCLNYDSNGNVESLSWNGKVLLGYDYSSDFGGEITYVVEDLSTLPDSVLQIGTLNPFRYHGYMYDAETGYYFTGALYYDPVSDSFYQEELPEKVEQSRVTVNEIIDYVNDQTSYLMSLAGTGHGAPIAYSSGWYNSLSTEDIVARLLYGEAGTELNDIRAVSWVLLNRYEPNNPNFYNGSHTIRNIATKPWEFYSITAGTAVARCSDENALLANPGNLQRFSTCTWYACAVCKVVNYNNNSSTGVNWSSIVTKPSYITTQKYFMSYGTFVSNVNQGYNYLYYNYNNQPLIMNSVAIPGIQGNIIYKSTVINISNNYPGGTISGIYNIYYNS